MIHQASRSLLLVAAALVLSSPVLAAEKRKGVHIRDPIPLPPRVPDKVKHGQNSPHVIGGVDTTFFEHPYYVDLSGRCGGSLIHNDLVLTLASCFGPGESVSAKVGPLQLTFNVLSGTQHPDFSFSFNPFVINNDFLILKLDEDATVFAAAEVIPLATSDDNLSGLQLDVVGLGITDPNDPLSFPDTLQQLTLNYFQSDTCSALVNTPITDDFLCAGSTTPNTGLCDGDLGAPLFRDGVQYGLLSWGVSCAAFPPQVYARVAHVADWIQDTICCLSDFPPDTCPPPSTLQCPNDLTIVPTPAPTNAPTASPLQCDDDGTALFRLELFTDGFGSETGWEVLDICTGIIVFESGGSNVYGDNITYVEQTCLDTSSLYTFRITDSFGDGILEPGYYEISYDGTVVNRGGANFTFEETELTPGENCPPVTPPDCLEGQILFKLDLFTDDYPQETTWTLTNTCTDEEVGSDGPYIGLVATQVTRFVCVDATDQHVFTIFDDANDGICCGFGIGNYSIFLDDQLIGSGAEYGPSESTIFGGDCTLNCQDNEVIFELVLATDQYPTDISWTLEDTCQDQVVAGADNDAYTFQFFTYVESYCVSADANLNFTILDSFSDGICCENGEGSYAVFRDGQFIAEGGDYGRSDSVVFGPGCGAESCEECGLDACPTGFCLYNFCFEQEDDTFQCVIRSEKDPDLDICIDEPGEWDCEVCLPGPGVNARCCTGCAATSPSPAPTPPPATSPSTAPTPPPATSPTPEPAPTSAAPTQRPPTPLPTATPSEVPSFIIFW